MTYTEISVRGIIINVPSVQVNDKTIIVTGKWLRVAGVKEEDFQEGEIVPDPRKFVTEIQQQGLRADIFTFSQKLTDPDLHYSFPYELDSIAAIRIASFSDWWTNRVSTDLRCDVRKAVKRGVVVRPVAFSDEFVRGIVGIYDETPVRHGRPFWHYMKGIDAVRRENATYLDRAEFLGAFVGDELIAFLKIVYVDHVARLMQIIAKDAYRDKRPMNALIAKAVQVCEARGCSHLTYGKYRYSRETDSLTTFKKRNGFDEILVPKYYIPLTSKGKLAVQLQLQWGPKSLVPYSVLEFLKRFRAFMYRYSLRPNRGIGR